MRKLKITVALLLAVVSAVFIATRYINNHSGKNDPPILKCDTDTVTVSVSDGDDVLLRGVSAYDNQDGDLTSGIVIGGISKLISDNTAKITYMVFDSDNNMARMTRLVKYTDYKKPYFTLDAPLLFDVGQTVSIKDRLRAEDTVDGDITSSIRVSALDLSSVNTGVYTITVQVTNSMGDTAELELPVVISENGKDRPAITLSSALVYAERDSVFDPLSYISSVTLPSGALADMSKVTYQSDVDTSVPGNYRVIYTYTDSGVTGTTALSVAVK